MIAYQQYPTSISEDVWALTQYVDHVAGLMGLGEWYFTVKAADLQSNIDVEGMVPAGQVEVFPGSKQATITFASNWANWTAEFLRETVVHELCHLFFNPIQDLITLQADAFGKVYLTPFTASIDHAIEQEVDRMSRKWAEHIPFADLSALQESAPEPKTAPDSWMYCRDSE